MQNPAKTSLVFEKARLLLSGARLLLTKIPAEKWQGDYFLFFTHLLLFKPDIGGVLDP